MEPQFERYTAAGCGGIVHPHSSQRHTSTYRERKAQNEREREKKKIYMPP